MLDMAGIDAHASRSAPRDRDPKGRDPPQAGLGRAGRFRPAR
jgi:hypothetical protein